MMLGVALDSFLAMTLGAFTITGIGVMLFAAYCALFTQVEATSRPEAVWLMYLGRSVIVVSILFVFLLVGIFIIKLFTVPA